MNYFSKQIRKSITGLMSRTYTAGLTKHEKKNPWQGKKIKGKNNRRFFAGVSKEFLTGEK